VTRRPLDGARRVTGDRASHAKYNVGAATDYGADMGEVVRAPFGGWVTRWWSSTGGNSVAITNSDYKFTGQHLSAYEGPGSGWLVEGSAIGYIGSTGTASSGPHLHGWIERLRDRMRLAFEEFLNSLGWRNTAANGGTVPGPFQTSTAGDIIKIITEKETGNMYLSWDTSGNGYLVTEQGWSGLPSMQVYTLFSRLINSKQDAAKPETFNRAEVAIMDAQLRLMVKANQADVALDPVKLAKAISDALPDQLNIEAEISMEQLAEAFELASPRVAAAIVKQSGELMAGI